MLVSKLTGATWQSVNHVRWLMHNGTGEIVVVVGGAANFAKTERAKREDMAFVLRTLH